MGQVYKSEVRKCRRALLRRAAFLIVTEVERAVAFSSTLDTYSYRVVCFIFRSLLSNF